MIGGITGIFNRVKQSFGFTRAEPQRRALPSGREILLDATLKLLEGDDSSFQTIDRTSSLNLSMLVCVENGKVILEKSPLALLLLQIFSFYNLNLANSVLHPETHDDDNDFCSDVDVDAFQHAQELKMACNTLLGTIFGYLTVTEMSSPIVSQANVDHSLGCTIHGILTGCGEWGELIYQQIASKRAVFLAPREYRREYALNAFLAGNISVPQEFECQFATELECHRYQETLLSLDQALITSPCYLLSCDKLQRRVVDEPAIRTTPVSRKRSLNNDDDNDAVDPGEAVRQGLKARVLNPKRARDNDMACDDAIEQSNKRRDNRPNGSY